MKKTVRESVWDWFRARTPFASRRWLKRQTWFNPVTQLIFGNKVYSQSYFDSVEEIERASVLVIGEWVLAHLKPTRVVDVGCGPGHMMAAMAKDGVSVFGVDISDAAIRKLAEKGLRGAQLDLTGPDPIPGAPYDLAVCCEVAEHLPAKHAKGLVRTLATAAPVVFLTAAEHDPRVGVGLYHFNEQPNQYWIDLMQGIGYALDGAMTKSARDEFTERKVIEYLAKPMIFRKAG